jgi:hypothetical protein
MVLVGAHQFLENKTQKVGCIILHGQGNKANPV